MTAQTLLEALKAVTEEAVKDLPLPTARQPSSEPEFRPPAVYIPRVPDGRQALKKVPYVLHMVESCHDWQDQTHVPQAQIIVRSILAIYSVDEMEGLFILYNLYEHIRVELLKRINIGEQFTLDLSNEGGIHFTPYTQLEAPYFAGEMITAWYVPGVRREIHVEQKDPYCEGQGVHVEYYHPGFSGF